MINIYSDQVYKVTSEEVSDELNEEREFRHYVLKNVSIYNGDDIIQRMKYMFNQDDFLGFACDGNKLVFDFYKPTGEVSTVTWELEGVQYVYKLFGKGIIQ